MCAVSSTPTTSLAGTLTLDSSVHDKSPRAKSERPGKLSVYNNLRIFGLQLLPALSSEPEKTKTAIHKSRRTAAIRSLVHVIPLCGALILVLLNVLRFHTDADFSPGSLTALQFAAKFHEMTMVASLSFTIVSYIRRELTSEHGVPFGAAFASLQVLQLTYLWSPELWGTIRSRSYNAWNKIRLAALIIIGALLIATVGPASAACMIPRLSLWPWANAIVGLNATLDALYPVNLSSSLYGTTVCNNGDLKPDAEEMPWLKPCPWALDYYGMSSLTSLPATFSDGTWNAYFPTYYPEPTVTKSHIEMNVNSGVTQTFTQGGSRWATVGYYSTLPSIGIVPYLSFDGSGTYTAWDMWDANSTVIVDIQETDYCYGWHWWDFSQSLPSLAFSADQTNVTNYLTDADIQGIRAGMAKQPYSLDAFYHNLTFVELGDDGIGGIVYMYSNSTFRAMNTSGLWLRALTYQLTWQPSIWDVQLYNISSEKDPSRPARLVRASRDWLATATPFVENANLSILNYLVPTQLSEAYVTNDTDYCGFDMNPENVASPVPYISLLLTTTLSRMTPIGNMCSGLNWGAWSPTAEWQSCNISLEQVKSTTSQFSAEFFNPEYGYAPNVLTVQISLAILILYCIVTMAHIAYSLITGISSSAWDTVSEVAALCLNSRPAEELQNTCAGIHTARVFERRVRVMATEGSLVPGGEQVANGEEDHDTDGDHLELLFESGQGAATSITKANYKYGAIKLKRG